MIDRGNELASLLRKAMEIEAGFESVAEWEGYVGVKKDEFRNILFELILESNGHRRTVESLLKRIRTSQESGERPLQSRVFSFKGKNELEVMTEISRIEKLMFDMYSDIRGALEKSNLGNLLADEKDSPSFLTTLDNLVGDEARHMSMISKYVSHVDRLR